MTHGIRTRQPKTARQLKLGAVGAMGWPAEQPDRPTRPLGPTASSSHVAAAHWLPMAVLQRSPTEDVPAGCDTPLYI